MSTKFYCNSDHCTDADKGPFVFELPQEAVMDGNNLATIFCPRCGKPMRQFPADTQKAGSSHRFYCHSDACRNDNNGLFFIDLPEEAILDDHNLATIFCPKCGKAMKPFA
ncbi:hypothetical protein DSCO28_53350 [Desulfosarcina ovata subsp. sediminis]|uniref:Uncharacterized protein n=1 Tax=Desulfosarcina ovata subsp. sediminis TaxID=885957 RepID=A0A5K7ZWY3_9BACT|nr:hypothetical protein [Desulfosarcina ovata]BBO84769.1 hypothetical protein DSCO28_53350 [Desulfosarcina ovata subsp. sediminis]